MKKNKFQVVELFAGVGGFRVGLERSSPHYETIWANQWEPGKKHQYAFDCYTHHYGNQKNHINEDIAIAKDQIPSHNLLVGGFPCQDYSVARTGALGIEGKKGVLWWHINDILTSHRPAFVVLENVDRLLKSPSTQRGRDFGVMLRCFNDLGYAVEWRVINAAEYGYAQRRRRIYLIAFHSSTSFYKELASTTSKHDDSFMFEKLYNNSFFTSIFSTDSEDNPKKSSVSFVDKTHFTDLVDVSNKFSTTLFNSGIMINGRVVSKEVTPIYRKPTTLRDIRHTEEVDEKYFLNGSLEKWEYLKGAKRIPRIKPNGEPYFFSEGAICFPDNLDKPGRTMLTSESSVNRSTHVIEDAVTGRLRLLTPIECERLNGFDDNWTNTGMPEKFRYFTMGNALVVPVVESIGKGLLEIL
ncbi:MAG: DNA (cytosine-5-)-methyltransferase [Oscillospiraceae bacterium]|nr:DNA (cytosine-5-)-methyltransferase [Oscillospiraceae bacterium]